MSIQRWGGIYTGDETMLMGPTPTGDYVTYSDHVEALRQARSESYADGLARGKYEHQVDVAQDKLYGRTYEQGQRDALADLVGASDAAKILGVSRQRVYQMVEEGKLPNRCTPVVFTRSEIEAIKGDGEGCECWLCRDLNLSCDKCENCVTLATTKEEP
jgi:predicted DNA-binding transcriptional regulator AlpA